MPAGVGLVKKQAPSMSMDQFKFACEHPSGCFSEEHPEGLSLKVYVRCVCVFSQLQYVAGMVPYWHSSDAACV